MPDAFHMFGFAGSLRRGSYNRGLLRAAVELAPEGVELETFELDAIPPFDQDVEDEGPPDSVRRLKEGIARARALLLVTPEYNYSVSGVMKNAIDWASRPPTTTPLKGKPVAVMGASSGGFGTVRAQMHLRNTLVYTQSLVLVTPEVRVSHAANYFDEDGNLTDETTRAAVAGLIEALVEWTKRLECGKSSAEAP